MVIEDLKTREISFFAFKMVDEIKKNPMPNANETKIGHQKRSLDLIEEEAKSFDEESSCIS